MTATVTRILIQPNAFDPWQLMAGFEAANARNDTAARTGATAVFVGTMRDLNEGDGVEEMTLERAGGSSCRYDSSRGAYCAGRGLVRPSKGRLRRVPRDNGVSKIESTILEA